jgi:UDP-N-acetylglucosamine 2-epimerase (non-hydrolysing)
LTVTAHRRETVPDLPAIAHALLEILELHPRATMVVALHKSPGSREVLQAALSGAARCHLIEPLPYDQFVTLLGRSTVLITDSGGIQEEATSIGRPVLVLRERTERPEAIEAGIAQLVGRDPLRIVARADALLRDARAWPESDVFGDGRASERVAAALLQQLAAARR